MKKYKFKTIPFTHQKTALEKCWDKKEYALFMEMGTGKTKVIIDNIGILKQQNLIDITVIVAPKSVYLNWEDEIATHLSDEIPHAIYAWNKTKKPIDAEILSGKLGVYLINVEALSHKSGVVFLNDLLKQYKRSIFVIDESTTIKNQSAARTKHILKLSKLAQYRRILTGSPVTKSPLDLYTQCAFLSPELLGYSSYYTFRARYAVMDQVHVGNNKFIHVPKYYVNLDELNHKLRQFSYRVRKDQCLDLPEKIKLLRTIQLSTEQRMVYNNLKERAIAIIQDESVSFNIKLVELLRLHQVTNGFLKTDEGNIKEFAENPKMDELLDVVEQIEGKAIIWANYVHNIESITNKLKELYGDNSVVNIYGGIEAEQRKEAVNRFQNDETCRFFVGNPSTGGFGLTLTAASYVIYYSNSYSYEVRLQSEDRAHRIGQKKNVTYIDIVAKDSIDFHIMKALQNKLQISNKTLGENIKNWI
jgi:SNF2 family DNA or RNA helicase